MSPDMGRPYEAASGRNGGSGSQGCGRGWSWKPVELFAMILGFVVFWPIGLAVIGWKYWQKKTGYQGDIVSFGREKWEMSRNWSWACGSGQGFSSRGWRGFSTGGGGTCGFGMSSTGNLAFDEWRAAELARLEEERQKLVAAEREFAEFMENLRRARDREEFDRFMAERRNQQGRESGAGPSI